VAEWITNAGEVLTLASLLISVRISNRREGKRRCTGSSLLLPTLHLQMDELMLSDLDEMTIHPALLGLPMCNRSRSHLNRTTNTTDEALVVAVEGA